MVQFHFNTFTIFLTIYVHYFITDNCRKTSTD